MKKIKSNNLKTIPERVFLELFLVSDRVLLTRYFMLQKENIHKEGSCAMSIISMIPYTYVERKIKRTKK